MPRVVSAILFYPRGGPAHTARALVTPRVPVVGQLHGSELLMLERIAAGPPASWRYADRWAERMRLWAQRCVRLVVAPAGVPRVLRLLDVPRERIVALSNGVETEQFTPLEVDCAAVWRRVLAQEPRGWLPRQPPGSVRYSKQDVE